ncbi:MULTISPECIES: hypothetical protein [unclassified Frankia]|nr:MULTISPECIES: hypothetical protein [unclassified Frankia]
MTVMDLVEAVLRYVERFHAAPAPSDHLAARGVAGARQPGRSPRGHSARR